MEIVIALGSIAVVVCIVWLSMYAYNIKKELHRLRQDRQNLLELHEEEKQKVRKDAKKRSGAVTWGLTIENFVPFMEDFPVPPENATFLGKPIDYVAFKNMKSKKKCEIHFIEVKSGNAFLLSHQKNIKTAIEEGRVYWHEIRVDSNGLQEDT